MAVPQVACQSTGATIAPGNPCNISAEAAGTGLADWAPLLNHRPPASVKSDNIQRFFTNRHFVPYGDEGYQPIEQGMGDCNMDAYVLDILQPPASLEGAAFTPEALLEKVRLNLNDFLDHREVWFEALADTDGQRFASSSPLGAVMRFWLGGKTSDPGQHIADGPVVCTDIATDHWIFSTLKVGNLGLASSGTHPVNGNRRFGIGIRKAGEKWSARYKDRIPVREKDTLFLYTRGVDRVSNPMFRAMSSTVFAGGHSCWLGFMRRVAKFLEGLGATVEHDGLWVSERYDWDLVTKPESKLWLNPPV